MKIVGPQWDGQPVLGIDESYHSVCLSFTLDDDEDEPIAVIPLRDIAINDELLFFKRQPSGKYDIDWDYSLQAKQEAITILKGWIAEMERQIEQDKKAQEEEQAA